MSAALDLTDILDSRETWLSFAFFSSDDPDLERCAAQISQIVREEMATATPVAFMDQLDAVGRRALQLFASEGRDYVQKAGELLGHDVRGWLATALEKAPEWLPCAPSTAIVFVRATGFLLQAMLEDAAEGGDEMPDLTEAAVTLPGPEDGGALHTLIRWLGFVETILIAGTEGGFDNDLVTAVARHLWLDAARRVDPSWHEDIEASFVRALLLEPARRRIPIEDILGHE